MFLRRRRGGTPAEGAGLFSFGDDFDVTDEQGRKVFKVDGKVFRVRDTLLFKDAEGRELYKIQQKLLRVRDSMDVKRDGEVVAHVHQALYTPLRDRFSIDLADGASSRPRATSSTTSTRSCAATGRPRSSPSAGSGSGTPTGSRSAPRRTPCSCWPSPSAWTCSPTRAADETPRRFP